MRFNDIFCDYLWFGVVFHLSFSFEFFVLFFVLFFVCFCGKVCLCVTTEYVM